jgi:hypothetical protein
MSFEESVLLDVMRAVNAVKLDAVLVGDCAAAMHGVPIATQVIELFIQDTPQNVARIDRFVSLLGPNVKSSRPFEPKSRTIRVEGLSVDIDFVFDVPNAAHFDSVKTRAPLLTIEEVTVRVSHLLDIVDAKKAAGRHEDLAALPLLQQALRRRQDAQKDRKGR